ncbi:MAG: hypothetical protein NTY38_25135 [Acidobacteria bacterium]|nr:hypothetical protein [Acidobacteriota bacterium]
MNYTWSKSIDDASGGLEPDFTNLGGQDSGAETIRGNPSVDSFCTTNERSVSSFNFPHILNFNGFYELPVGKGKRYLAASGILTHVLGNVQVGSLLKIAAGQPAFLDLGNSNNIGIASGSFQPNPRPNVVAGMPLRNPDWTPQNATYTPYVNPRAFSVPDPGTFGNAPRNLSLQMPWTRSVDASVYKNIYPWGENRQRHFQLRVEAFNVFNMHTFGFAGFQTNLFTGLTQNRPGQPNRYKNLTPDVWTAIMKQDPGGLSGTPASATPAGEILSPFGVYQELGTTFNRNNFYLLGASSMNSVAPRVLQFALKFYF